MFRIHKQIIEPLMPPGKGVKILGRDFVFDFDAKTFAVAFFMGEDLIPMMISYSKSGETLRDDRANYIYQCICIGSINNEMELDFILANMISSNEIII